jgi:hypothetical protein
VLRLIAEGGEEAAGVIYGERGAEFGQAPGFVLHFLFLGISRLVLVLQIVCNRLSQLRFTLGFGMWGAVALQLAEAGEGAVELAAEGAVVALHEV